jgi:hypothetical protein
VTHDTARELIARALDRAVTAHEERRFADLAAFFDEIDIPDVRCDGDTHGTIALALNFFDGWVDASNHEWQFYEGIARDDWPVLAREISTSLRSRTPIDSADLLAGFSSSGRARRAAKPRRWWRARRG